MPVFISHSHKDEALYSTLTLALEGVKIPWVDITSFECGESLSDQLRDAIEECEVCIFLATKRSLEAPWCHAELGAFWGAGKRVILYRTDPELDEDQFLPQFKGKLWARSASQLLASVREALPLATCQVFLASPMAACANEDDYQALRKEVLKVSQAFRDHCGLSVYCAMEQCTTKHEFEAEGVSVKKDFRAIRNSRYFVLLYPYKTSSSVLVEAGFALALRKYSIYFVASREDLPFMLRDAQSIFNDVHLQELSSCSKDFDCIVDAIRINKCELFNLGSNS